MLAKSRIVFSPQKMLTLLITGMASGCMSSPTPLPEGSSSVHSTSSMTFSSHQSSSNEISSEALSSSSQQAAQSSNASSSEAATALPLVVAINAGGPELSFNGVHYIADRFANGGMVNSTQDNVVGGALYQTERYGSLRYDIPVTASGLYTVELHFAEIYQNNPDSRNFSVAIEGTTVIENLDLFSLVGHDSAYTKTINNISVNDGKVTIELIADIENPTLAGLAVYSRDGILDTSVVATPDLSKFSAYTQQYNERTVINSNHATGHIGDLFFTHWKDGGATSLTMDTNGDFSVSWQGGGYNYVGGPGWHYGDENRVIGYRFNEDSGASYITLYGWGYDKNMPRSNPAHLVEYYILQRWSYDPSQGATFGKTFISNGVEYSTYRSLREQKPSINNTATFYQYWSKPSQPQALGQDHKIIFADHVKAWADSGWILPNMNNLDASDDPTYQVMAVEVFNPNRSGTAAGRVWEVTNN